LLMSTSYATSRTVRQRFPRITPRTLSTWSSFVDVEGRPGLRTSPTYILPSLNCLNHSLHCVRVIQSSPYTWLSNWNVCDKVYQVCSKISHTHTHTHMVFPALSLSLIRRTACARALFSVCSSTTNSHSETGQMAVCFQTMSLGTLSRCSALSVLVGAVFKKFSPFWTGLVWEYFLLFNRYYADDWKLIGIQFKLPSFSLHFSNVCFFLTYTSWSGNLLEKLTSFQLVKNIPAFYRTQRFITAFTSTRHLSLSWARSIQSMPQTHFLEINLNIILPFTPGS
jgi:hypothetical protein